MVLIYLMKMLFVHSSASSRQLTLFLLVLAQACACIQHQCRHIQLLHHEEGSDYADLSLDVINDYRKEFPALSDAPASTNALTILGSRLSVSMRTALRTNSSRHTGTRRSPAHSTSRWPHMPPQRGVVPTTPCWQAA